MRRREGNFSASRSFSATQRHSVSTRRGDGFKAWRIPKAAGENFIVNEA